MAVDTPVVIVWYRFVVAGDNPLEWFRLTCGNFYYGLDSPVLIVWSGLDSHVVIFFGVVWTRMW